MGVSIGVGGSVRAPGAFPRAGERIQSKERAKLKKEQLAQLQDRELEEARRRAREAERLRRGRQASIMTSTRGVTEPLGSVDRPRASSLLGG